MHFIICLLPLSEDLAAIVVFSCDIFEAGFHDGNLLVLTGFGGKMIAERLSKEKTVKLGNGAITVRSKIFNHQHPDAILAFHCDYPQLEFSLAKLKPEILIPFHAAPFSLAKAYVLSKKFGAETYFPRKGKEIFLK